MKRHADGPTNLANLLHTWQSALPTPSTPTAVWNDAHRPPDLRVHVGSAVHRARIHGALRDLVPTPPPQDHPRGAHQRQPGALVTCHAPRVIRTVGKPAARIFLRLRGSTTGRGARRHHAPKGEVVNGCVLYHSTRGPHSTEVPHSTGVPHSTEGPHQHECDTGMGVPHKHGSATQARRSRVDCRGCGNSTEGF